jgi:hypothetical protein
MMHYWQTAIARFLLTAVVIVVGALIVLNLLGTRLSIGTPDPEQRSRAARTTPTPAPTVAPAPTSIPVPAPQPEGLTVSRRVGVNTHAGYVGTAYTDVALTRNRIEYLGVGLVRDSGRGITTTGPRLAGYGADVIVYCGGEFDRWWGEFQEQQCALGADALVPRLVAVEGANEPYGCPGQTASADQQRLVNHMTRLRDAAFPLGVETYSVSNCADSGDRDWWALPPVGGVVNNGHSYAAPGSYPRLAQTDNWIRNTQFAAPGRRVSTEMGAYEPYESGELNGATWQLVAVFHHLYRGAERMAIYELQDSGSDDSPFGFWSASGERRQAADAMHNLMGLIGDTVVGSLSPGVSVSDPAGTALSLTFTNGAEEYVAVWNRASTGTRTVTVNLGKSRAATVYRPVTSGEGAVRAAAASHQVSLGNEPVVMRLG